MGEREIEIDIEIERVKSQVQAPDGCNSGGQSQEPGVSSGSPV